MRQLAKVLRWGGIVPALLLAPGCPNSEFQRQPAAHSRVHVAKSNSPEMDAAPDPQQEAKPPEGTKTHEPMPPSSVPMHDAASQATNPFQPTYDEGMPSQGTASQQAPVVNPFATEPAVEKPVPEAVAAEKLKSLGGQLTRDDSTGELTLNLALSPVQDADLVWIAHIKAVKHLDLSGTAITNTGLENLGTLPALELLNLANTRIGDESLSALVKMPRLKYLVLNGTKVTDRGLALLSGQTVLEGLSVLETSLSAEAVAEFKKRHPECTVIHRGQAELQSQPKETRSATELPKPAALPGKIDQWQTWDDPKAPVPPMHAAHAGLPESKSVLVTADWKPCEDFQAAFPTEPAPAEPTVTQAAVTVPGVQVDAEWLAPDFMATVSEVYVQRGEMDKAVHVLQQAVRLHPQSSELHHQLGIAVGRTGDLNTSFLEFQKVHGEAAAHYNLGIIVYENALKTSRDHFQRALLLDPTMVEAKAWLRHLGTQQGQSDGPQIVPNTSSASQHRPQLPVME